MNAPFFAFEPKIGRTEFPAEILKSSYIDPSEDRENIRNDFQRATRRAEKELNSRETRSE